MFTLKSMNLLLQGMHAAKTASSASPYRPAEISPPRNFVPETQETVDDKDQESYFISISRGM